MKPAPGSYILEQTPPHMEPEPLVCIIIQFNRRLNLRHILMTALPLITLNQGEHQQTLVLERWEYGTAPETLVRMTSREKIAPET